MDTRHWKLFVVPALSIAFGLWVMFGLAVHSGRNSVVAQTDLRAAATLGWTVAVRQAKAIELADEVGQAAPLPCASALAYPRASLIRSCILFVMRSTIASHPAAVGTATGSMSPAGISSKTRFAHRTSFCDARIEPRSPLLASPHDLDRVRDRQRRT